MVKQQVEGEVKRQGNAIVRGTVRCGKISYFLHWDPAAVLAACELHSDCYATWPLATSPDDDRLVKWLGEAPAYQNGKDHMRSLPPGWYQHRPRR